MPRDTTAGWEVEDSGIAVVSPMGEICECATGDNSTFTLEEMEAHARLIATSPKLLAACKAQHRAIDTLLAMLVGRDPNFLPSKSGVWPAVQQGNAAIAKAEGRV